MSGKPHTFLVGGFPFEAATFLADEGPTKARVLLAAMREQGFATVTLHNSMRELRKAGLIESFVHLTKAGRDALERTEEREERKRLFKGTKGAKDSGAAAVAYHVS